MMTLDEAIKRAEEVAEENQRVIDTGIVFNDVTIDMLYCDDTEVIDEHLANYQRCAEEYRKLAEWLRDYKRLLGAIQDIKAEILCLLKSEELCDEYDIGCNDGLKLALSRIDKHISGKDKG